MIQGTTPEEFTAAVQAEAARRMADFSDGVKRYKTSPPTGRPIEPPAIWQRGSARLLDYGATVRGAADGPPLICIPSLINRGYILDLTESSSLLRSLAAQGHRPLLMDWGTPNADERAFTLTDYIDGHLATALDHVTETTGRRAGLLGYCMGGDLAIALAAAHPDQVTALALLATPWDFQAGHAASLPFLAAMRPGLDAIIDALGVLPVDLLQALFAGLNPALTEIKFRQFAALPADSAKARAFIALEDWLNDGVPLAGPVARECLFGWYLENTPMAGQWRVGGRPVDPGRLEHPAFVIVPGDDYIVPPQSARPLAELLPNAKLSTVKAGHIGMVAGGRTKSLLQAPLAAWLSAHVM